MNPQVRHPVTFGAAHWVESCQLDVRLAYAVPGTQLPFHQHIARSIGEPSYSQNRHFI